MTTIVRGAVLAHLRLATRAAHDRLEGGTGLTDESLDLAAYRNQLQRFHGFWRGWQPLVAARLQDDAFLAPRRRLHLLADDLAALGLSQAAIDALPICPMPALADAAAAIGSLYVMEGSTLGGRVILGHLERRFGLTGLGCSYFTGYGSATGAMWRSFLARLDLCPMAQAHRIAAGATATFDQVGWWLRRE